MNVSDCVCMCVGVYVCVSVCKYVHYLSIYVYACNY